MAQFFIICFVLNLWKITLNYRARVLNGAEKINYNMGRRRTQEQREG
jgi:hypothetical protein